MEIETYKSSTGKDPIWEYIESQDEKTQKKILWQLRRVDSGDIGKLIMARILEKMTTNKPDIFEMKVKYSGKEHRFLGGIVRSSFYITHAFKKKEQKTRNGDINLAQERLKRIM